MGAPVYRRLGYETLFGWAEYVRWPRRPEPLSGAAADPPHGHAGAPQRPSRPRT